MDNKNINIEEVFNKSFNTFEYKPDSSVWDNIENNLNESFVENTYKDKFVDYKYIPNAKTWDKIAAVLWLDSFLKFSYKTFNVYYLSGILAVLVSIGAYLLENIDNEYLHKNISNNSINNIKTRNVKLLDSKPDSYIIIDSLDNLNNPAKVYRVENNDSLISNACLNKTGEVKNNNVVDVNIDSNNVETKYLTKYIKDTVIIIDTLKLYITDTIFKEKPEISAPKTVSSWSVDMYFMPMYSNAIIDAPASIKNTITNSMSSDFNWTAGININYSLKNINIQSGLLYTVLGEKFSYTEENTTVNTNREMRYRRVGEHMVVDKYTIWEVTDYQSIIDVDTTEAGYELIEREYNNTIIIDTVWHYHVDTVYRQIPVDSVETVKYDTIMVVEYDSVEVVIADTVKNKTIYDVINRYSYIEIPLIVGYEFKTKTKISYVLSGGIVAGVFINAQGKGITLKNEITDLQHLPFAKVNLTGILSAGIHYKLTDELSVMLEGAYRRNFTSIYEQNYFLKQKFSTMGLRLGIRFKL